MNIDDLTRGPTPMAAKKKAKEVKGKITPTMKRTFAIRLAMVAYENSWEDVAEFEKALKRNGYKVVVA